MRKQPSVISLALIIWAIIAVATSQAEEPKYLWEFSSPSNIKWQKIAPTGHLIVSTDDALLALDPVTGATVWSSAEMKGLDDEKFDIVEGTQFALISKGKGILGGGKSVLILLDLSTGKEMWNTEAVGMTSNNGYFLLADIGAMLLCGPTGKNMNDRDVMVVDLETGKEIWRNEEFFKKYKAEFVPAGKTKVTLKGNQSPVFDTEETMIVFWSKEGLRKLNAKTGEIIWTTQVKCGEAPAPAYGYGQMVLSADRSVLYAPLEKSIVALSTKDGHLIWTKMPQLKGLVYQMDFVDGLLVVKGGPNFEGKDGDDFITVLDPTTGEVKWKKPFDKLKKSSSYVIKDGKIVVYTDEKLYAISIADASFTELAKGVEFAGKEVPGMLALTSKGYRLESSQNVMMLGFDGAQVFHTYYKAPGSSLFAKIASTTAVMAFNAASAAQGYSNAMNNAYANGGTGSAKYSLITSNPYMSKRYKASQTSSEYLVMLTDVKSESGDGPGLVKVNKLTGETEEKIVLGTKKPEYEADTIEGRLFFKSDDKKITCFGF
jgi:outer membrane protein assembly factor BamB